MSPTTVSPLSVRVLLFARYAELFGTDTVVLRLAAPATVGDAIARLRAFPGGEALPRSPLCAVNLRQAGSDLPLADGDEVALLPPMAGG